MKKEFVNMTENITEDIRQRLFELRDEKYRAFQEKLKPSASPVIGVRSAELRKTAKELAKGCWREYVSALNSSSYYEERTAAGMSIYYAKTDIGERMEYTDIFLPFIDGWAVCDGVCATIRLKKDERDRFWEYAVKKVLSGEEFVSRFGLVAILHDFVDEEHINGIFDIIERINYAGFYDSVGAAWLLAECMTKLPERTFEYMRVSRLNDMVYNKAIQKMRESYRVSPEIKNELKRMTRA